jgi:hypothetical protein
VLWWLGVRVDGVFGQQNDATEGSNRAKSLASPLFIKITVLSFQNIRPHRFGLAKRTWLFMFVFHPTLQIYTKKYKIDNLARI